MTIQFQAWESENQKFETIELQVQPFSKHVQKSQLSVKNPSHKLYSSFLTLKCA